MYEVVNIITKESKLFANFFTADRWIRENGGYAVFRVWEW